MAALLAAAAVAACRSAAPRAAPADLRPASATPAAAGAPARPPADRARHSYTEADVQFVQGMIAHHGQALEMTALVPGRASRAELSLLAERIEVSQQDEIALMQRWLERRGEEVPSLHSHHSMQDRSHHAGRDAMGGQHELMPGMLTPEEMARLSEATGADFDRLFLQGMIRHHEGALTMVARLLATPGAGQESELFRFASDVDADQRAEIARMQALLRTLQAPPSAGSPRR